MATPPRTNHIETMSKEIRIIYNSDISNAETLIGTYLEQRLREYPTGNRLDFLRELSQEFRSFIPKQKTTQIFGQEELSRLFSLLLGRNVSTTDLSTADTMQKLVNSLNTVFDTINQIISVMNNKLFGKEAQYDKTIRAIIGSNLEMVDPLDTHDSLQSYLDQIQNAFLVAHQAFQQAAQTRVRKMLEELDPERITASSKKGYKFGPFRKAELFEVYQEKFKECRSWFEAGCFTDELLREFEKTCQKSYKVKTRNI